jgi:predicted transposase YbfD/YdcC
LGIENGLHWVLDVQFKEDQSRLRRGHGATNMAMVRHLALNLIRAMPGKQSIKAKRKLATWDTNYLMAALQAH